MRISITNILSYIPKVKKYKIYLNSYFNHLANKFSLLFIEL